MNIPGERPDFITLNRLIDQLQTWHPKKVKALKERLDERGTEDWKPEWESERQYTLLQGELSRSVTPKISAVYASRKIENLLPSLPFQSFQDLCQRGSIEEIQSSLENWGRLSNDELIQGLEVLGNRSFVNRQDQKTLMEALLSKIFPEGASNRSRYVVSLANFAFSKGYFFALECLVLKGPNLGDQQVQELFITASKQKDWKIAIEHLRRLGLQMNSQVTGHLIQKAFDSKDPEYAQQLLEEHLGLGSLNQSDLFSSIKSQEVYYFIINALLNGGIELEENTTIDLLNSAWVNKKKDLSVRLIYTLTREEDWIEVIRMIPWEEVGEFTELVLSCRLPYLPDSVKAIFAVIEAKEGREESAQKLLGEISHIEPLPHRDPSQAPTRFFANIPQEVRDFSFSVATGDSLEQVKSYLKGKTDLSSFEWTQALCQLNTIEDLDKIDWILDEGFLLSPRALAHFVCVAKRAQREDLVEKVLFSREADALFFLQEVSYGKLERLERRISSPIKRKAIFFILTSAALNSMEKNTLLTTLIEKEPFEFDQQDRFPLASLALQNEVSFLLQKLIQATRYPFPPAQMAELIEIAARKGDETSLSLLLSKAPSLHKSQKEAALLAAVENGHLACVERLTQGFALDPYLKNTLIRRSQNPEIRKYLESLP